MQGLSIVTFAESAETKAGGSRLRDFIHAPGISPSGTTRSLDVDGKRVVIGSSHLRYTRSTAKDRPPQSQTTLIGLTGLRTCERG